MRMRYATRGERKVLSKTIKKDVLATFPQLNFHESEIKLCGRKWPVQSPKIGFEHQESWCTRVGKNQQLSFSTTLSFFPSLNHDTMQRLFLLIHPPITFYRFHRPHNNVLLACLNRSAAQQHQFLSSTLRLTSFQLSFTPSPPFLLLSDSLRHPYISRHHTFCKNVATAAPRPSVLRPSSHNGQKISLILCPCSYRAPHKHPLLRTR